MLVWSYCSTSSERLRFKLSSRAWAWASCCLVGRASEGTAKVVETKAATTAATEIRAASRARFARNRKLVRLLLIGFKNKDCRSSPRQTLCGRGSHVKPRQHLSVPGLPGPG